MPDTDTQWPRDLFTFAIHEGEHSGTYVRHVEATVPRWDGDADRERDSHKYIDADIFDSQARYFKAERDKHLAEIERLRGVVEPIAGTEWEKAEPGDRDQLPDDWVAYIEEMEAFCNHYTHEASAALEGGE